MLCIFLYFGIGFLLSSIMLFILFKNNICDCVHNESVKFEYLTLTYLIIPCWPLCLFTLILFCLFTLLNKVYNKIINIAILEKD